MALISRGSHPRAKTGRLHRELGLDPQVPIVGAVGQIILRKGFDVLARAASLLAPRFADLRYVIVGSRWSRKAEAVEFERRLKRDFGRDALGGRAHFMGTRDDVDQLLPELTLLAHPARRNPWAAYYSRRPACGVPIVATDVGGTREIFPAAANAALLVPPDDAKALTEAIAKLLDDLELRCALADAAHQRARKAFDARQAGAMLAKHYKHVVADSGARRESPRHESVRR